jgi:hypothetical protein
MLARLSETIDLEAWTDRKPGGSLTNEGSDPDEDNKN